MLETNANEKTIHHLNSFLRGELSAVETYRQALAKLRDFQYRSTLEACVNSHSSRVGALEQEIIARGGQPSFSAGVWGGFAQAVEGSASVLGAKAAVAALEEGEDHGINDYVRDTDKLDDHGQKFMVAQIIPEQRRTHEAMSRLKDALA